jgi:leucyl aminopeptidase
MNNFSLETENVCPIIIISKQEFIKWNQKQSTYVKRWVKTNAFKGALFDVLSIPSDRGGIDMVLFGWGEPNDRLYDRFHFAKIRDSLQPGTYKISDAPADFDLMEAFLAWGLSGYTFDKYKKRLANEVQLVLDDEVNEKTLEALITGEYLIRDLINTPASDLGPEDLANEVEILAARFGAKQSSIVGKCLLEQNFPMIHAVGRASKQEPRLIDFCWGNENSYKVTLVGKGVCFDTGGLNIKPSGSMGLMKKDMGGAATVLGLANMIMEMNLDVRLRVLIPAVENSISAESFRPQDILISRKGLTVEVNNTDAEGRLVLADALSYADEERPDLLICMATLTGAARVALGPDIAPFFTDSSKLAKRIFEFGEKYFDPVWRLPFWDPYEKMIEPELADLDNAPKSGFAGSITAALFLRRFVEKSKEFVHFDIYGWSETGKISRPKGGVGMASRALFYLIKDKVKKNNG